MGKAIAIAVGAGAASAFLVLSTAAMGLSGGAIFTLLTPLPLYLAGLSLGLPGAAIAAVAAALLVMLAAGDFAPGLGILLVYGIPVALVVRQALLNRPGAGGRTEWYPPGRVVLWIVGYGLVGLIAAVVLTLGQPGGLAGAVATPLEEMTEAMPPDAAQAIRDVGTEGIARILPGIIVLVWSVQMLATLWLAHGVLAGFNRSIRPTFDIADLEMPGWLVTGLAIAGVVAAAAPGMAGFLALNAALALGFCFFMSGLAVIHAAVRTKPFKRLALAAVYLSLILFTWPALFVAGLGVIEQWAGFRRRALARNRED